MYEGIAIAFVRCPSASTWPFERIARRTSVLASDGARSAEKASPSAAAARAALVTALPRISSQRSSAEPPGARPGGSLAPLVHRRGGRLAAPLRKNTHRERGPCWRFPLAVCRRRWVGRAAALAYSSFLGVSSSTSPPAIGRSGSSRARRVCVFFSQCLRVSGAGGAAAAAEAEGGCLRPVSGASWTLDESGFTSPTNVSRPSTTFGRGRCCVDFYSEATGSEGGWGGRRDAGGGGGRAGRREGQARRRAAGGAAGEAAGVVGAHGGGGAGGRRMRG